MREITKIFEQTMMENGTFVQDIDEIYHDICTGLSAEDDESMNMLYEYTVHIMQSAFTHGFQCGFNMHTELNK